MKQLLMACVCVLTAGTAMARDLGDDFTAYVERARAAADIPGMAVAVVRDGKVVYAHGFGVRKRGEAALVTPDTMFEIGSTSKAFTVAALALLVEQKKIAWDDKVKTYLPWLEHDSPFVREEMTVRDLVANRYGISYLVDSQPIFAARSDRSAEDIVRRSAKLPREAGFRDRYSYSNTMFIAAGLLIEKVSGVPFEQFLREQLLRQVGAGGAVFEPAEAIATGDYATPHAADSGVAKPIAWTRPNAALAATGGLIASSSQLANWLRFQLAYGKIDGKQLLSEAQVREMQAPRAFLADPKREAPQFPQPETLQSDYWAYGLGWYVNGYKGRKMVWHSGGSPGFRAGMVMLPNDGLGVVVLTNRYPTQLNFAVALRAIDTLLDLPETDWAAQFLAARQNDEAGERDRMAALESKRLKAAKQSLPTEAYTGHYDDAGAFGALDITVDAKKRLRATLGRYEGTLEHWHQDIFRVRWDRDFDPQFLRFDILPDGTIGAAHLDIYAPFARVRR
jgi:CubicO group peptidase (beta-lactamase class C family)